MGIVRNKKRILDALPKSGSSLGGARLRALTGLDNEGYRAALEALRTDGAVVVGRGQGGSIRLAQPETAPQRSVGRLPSREIDLYQPFVEWLRSSWTDDADTAFHDAQITGTSRGWKRASGQWSRPDVIEIEVIRYDRLPHLSVEVTSYEIKTEAGVTNLACVYEALAHTRWAQRSVLVLEHSRSEAVRDDVIGEANRHGLGLWVMTRRGGSELDISVELEPEVRQPEPTDLNELLRIFFGLFPARSRAYQQVIGR